MKDLWNQFKTWLLGEIHWIDVLFMGIGFTGWVHNMESVLKLDLNWLIQFYGVIRTAMLGNKAIDSKYNSPQGTPPGKDGK